MVSSEEVAETNDTASKVADFARRKRRILVWLLVYAGLFGVVLVFLDESNRLIDFLSGLPVLVLGIAWCHVDAEQHDYRMGRIMRVSLILLFGLAFPIYLLRTRGLNGLVTLGLTVLFAAAMCVCLSATAFLTLFIGYLADAWEL